MASKVWKEIFNEKTSYRTRSRIGKRAHPGIVQEQLLEAPVARRLEV